MRPSHRISAILALLLIISASAVFAAPKIEGTPVPMRPKPDMSSMQFLIGTWECTDVSSRRPAPFTVTEVYTMDPSGYWVIRDSTIHKGTASWIPSDQHAQSKYTYDSIAKQWIRITTADNGGYAIATAGMPANNKKIYTYVMQSKSPDVASYAPEVYVKDAGNTKKTMTTSFTEKNGRVVTVKETCTKS